MDSDYGAPASPMELTGDEVILPGVRVVDFWAWALGDLRLNSTRGLLAQFLVGKAVGDTRRIDTGWAPYDVESANGVKIEVKASAYLQSWKQTKLSSIKFSGLITSRWDEVTGTASERMVIADVYVFAVHTSRVAAQYDPLDITPWEFYVLPGSKIRELNQSSMGLSTVQKHAGEAVGWHQLHEAIERANTENAAPIGK